jgi:hypothetical protein
MQSWFARAAFLVVLGLAGWGALAVGRGQEGPSPQPTGPATPTNAEIGRRQPDLEKLPPLQRQLAVSAEAGAEWLCRANRPDGRFAYGLIPALNAPLAGDHYLRQIGGALALAREARYTGNARHAAVARQALLTLLLDTAPDAQDGRLRSTTLPSAIVNKVAAGGLLALAIYELPAPGDDLLEQAEQLCCFIAQRQNPDGSLRLADGNADSTPTKGDSEGMSYLPGEALAGMAASQRMRSAPWKAEVIRKALPFYQAWWQAHPSLAFAPWQTVAFGEAYLLTRDQLVADYVFAMSDWVCRWQYGLDPRHPLWMGGFPDGEEGRSVVEPQAASALVAEGLAAACRCARQAGDLTRYHRYREALERCLQFLTTLQYTQANTQHFADWYRPALAGGFHSSHQDGNLRIDYSQHAVCALVQYLAFVASDAPREGDVKSRK